MQDKILIKGARQHNLKNINIEIPRNKFVVITGLSGSGKSSLAFDTIYAEGQRRYVESLSAYARQFLGQMDKPDVDYIEGLSPAISIDQRTTSRNPRSTVGTVTEIYDYLRLLFARIGHSRCPKCNLPISQQTVDQMIDQLMMFPEGSRIIILAPIIRGKKGEHHKIFEYIRKNGFIRVRINKKIYDIDELVKLDKNKRHTIEIVIDRLILDENEKTRIGESLETALKFSDGIVIVEILDNKEVIFSQNFACPDCGLSFPEIAPRMFSFNSPFGACQACTGLGVNLELDLSLVIPDLKKTFSEGAIAPLSNNVNSYFMRHLEAVLKKHGYSICNTWESIPETLQKKILWGTIEEKFIFEFENMYSELKNFNLSFEGIIPILKRRYKETNSDLAREDIEKYMSNKACPCCMGARLKPEALSVIINNHNIYDVTKMNIVEAQQFFKNITLTHREKIIGDQILKEINARLGFLINVGLDYITLNRNAGTLSGGEAQRIRLATQIGSGLMGVLYILDEPSIGLHQRDNNRLLQTLQNLRDMGNTLLVVEHDEDTMYAADHIIDIGPGAGANGGSVIAQGTVNEIKQCKQSITGQYLCRNKFIPVPLKRRPLNGKWIEVVGACENNLKNIKVSFPLGIFTTVTGVSGSGKSTLVNEILYKGLSNKIYKTKIKTGKHYEINGSDYIDKIIDINQSPIGRTPRSNPATYTGLFDFIREIFSQTYEARARGYKPGRFSFNVKGGRCEACRGDGIIKIEMHFLPNVYVPCEICKGARYNRETLEVRYKDKNISHILNMIVDDAIQIFRHIPNLSRKLQVLQDVGLGYIKLGQSATTLSGGEAQRIKLATELSKRSTGKTLYILDEPTTGLHTADIHKLLEVLQRLVNGGNTVIVIEHNLDVIKTADYCIDLGPDGGINGGELVVCGTPEEIVLNEKSYTGKYLKYILNIL